MEEKINALLQQLTLEEKISMLAGADLWHTVPVERLGIPQIRVTDGPNGARGAEGDNAPRSVCTPVGVALAATWNPALVEKVGQVLGEETRLKGCHILLAPTVNLHRTPLAGRNFECYSEDPYLTAQMAVAYINGLQRQGVGACIKHYVANDQEFERNSISAEVRERALRELYLYPFQVAIAEAQPWAVMSAYNKINGTWASENETLLHGVLKGEWGFDGIVMSDWMGTYTDGPAAGGLDLEMPGPARWMGENVLHMVQSGQLEEGLIDDKVRRLLRTIARVGAFEQPELQPEGSQDKPEHRAIVRQAAAEAIVLLKNEGALLPVEPGQYPLIAVIGENAVKPPIMGGGSSQVSPHPSPSPLQAIIELAGKSSRVEYAVGQPLHKNLPALDANLVSSAGQTGFRVEVFDNLDLAGEPVVTRSEDRSGFSWSERFVAPADPNRFSARLTGTFTPTQSGRYIFNVNGNGLNRMFVDGQMLVDHWSPAQAGSPWDAAADGVPLDLQAGQGYQLVIEFAYQGDFPWRGLHLNCLPPQPADPQGEALALAARADLVLLFAGHTREWEAEGFDRPDMELPCNQNELIENLLKVNPNTVVILNTGAPVRMPWVDAPPALLQAWFGGQEMGPAIAQVLFGQVNPSGKLPTTFPQRLQDNPAYLNYPGENGRVFYGEGLFIGYRYYDYKDIAPLFPFGHGLSYTSFEYGNLSLSAESIQAGEALIASVPVTNIGTRPGQEIVQLYLRDSQARLVRPLKELKGFLKLDLAPGETQVAEFEIRSTDLQYYDDELPGWVAEPGCFELFIGASSQDLRVAGSFELLGAPDGGFDLSSRLHIGLPVEQLLADPAAKAVLEKYLGQHLANPQVQRLRALSLLEIAPQTEGFLNEPFLRRINQDLALLD